MWFQLFQVRVDLYFESFDFSVESTLDFELVEFREQFSNLGIERLSSGTEVDVEIGLEDMS